MTTILDRTDVPLVAPEELTLPMQILIDSGRGLVMLRGLSESELRDVDAAIWQEWQGDAVRRTAVALRFRCLIAVFASRRLQDLLLQRGFSLIAPAVAIAAQMRLNTQWGFNPLKFERALRDLLARLDRRHERAAAMRQPEAAALQ